MEFNVDDEVEWWYEGLLWEGPEWLDLKVTRISKHAIHAVDSRGAEGAWDPKDLRLVNSYKPEDFIEDI